MGMIEMTERNFRGYVLEVGAHEMDTPSEWFGVFHIIKNGKMIANKKTPPVASYELAHNNAMKAAEDYVDGLAPT